MNPSTGSPPLEAYLLGIVDYQEIQRLQRRMVYECGERPGASLVLCEHPPTISVGRGGSRAHIAADDDTLKSLGIRVHWTNRGGGCNLHLPGQLAAYLVMPLAPDLSIIAYLERLQRAVIDMLAEFDLVGTIRADLPGVFLGQARVATVGVAVNRWIAYHGLTINVGPFLDLFDLIEEPGIGSVPLRQTSMESRRQRQAPMSKVRESLLRQLERTMGLERHHVYTRHPLIRRKVLCDVYAPSPG